MELRGYCRRFICPCLCRYIWLPVYVIQIPNKYNKYSLAVVLTEAGTITRNKDGITRIQYRINCHMLPYSMCNEYISRIPLAALVKT